MDSPLFAPAPLSPWKHSSLRIFRGLGQTEPSIAVLNLAITYTWRRIAAALTCSGASQLLPFLRAMQVWTPGLTRSLHRRHAAWARGQAHNPRSHSHVRPAPSRCPLPAGAGTGQHLGPRCRARLPVHPRPRRRPCTCCSFRLAAARTSGCLRPRHSTLPGASG